MIKKCRATLYSLLFPEDMMNIFLSPQNKNRGEVFFSRRMLSTLEEFDGKKQKTHGVSKHKMWKDHFGPVQKVRGNGEQKGGNKREKPQNMTNSGGGDGGGGAFEGTGRGSGVHIHTLYAVGHDYLDGGRGSCLMNTHWNTVSSNRHH